jgi:outer membrane protein
MKERIRRGISDRAMALAASLAVALLALAPSAFSQQARALTPEGAVKAALSGDERARSAKWDALAAQAKAKEAELRALPSLSLSANYTRLSDLKSAISFGGMPIEIDSLDNSFSISANLQYPVFAGYRLRESKALASVQAEGKEVAAEMVRRSIVFEAQRAYWEAERASRNVAMLKESRAIAAQSLEVTQKQADLGTAIKADLLAARMRADQAGMDLGAAVAAQKRAFWNLASLVETSFGEGESTPDDPIAAYDLTAEPAPVADGRFPTLDEKGLVARALAERPETRTAALATRAAVIGERIAEAPLYPTLNLSGGYLLADPNQRVFMQSDPWKFTGTWTLGATLSYDLGGLPANLAARDAQRSGVQKSRADEARQRETVALDVKLCLLAFDQARRDYDTVSAMIDQARENERVAEQKYEAGSASDLDLQTARIARLKIEFQIANKLIDEQIAAADLERAAALADAE